MIPWQKSGQKVGGDLTAWCVEQGGILPSVEKLVFHLLNTITEPDPECGWADPEKFGAALLSLVEDNSETQMQILFAIQRVSFLIVNLMLFCLFAYTHSCFILSRCLLLATFCAHLRVVVMKKLE